MQPMKEVTGSESPSELKAIARECARKCGCTHGLNDDSDVIVVMLRT